MPMKQVYDHDDALSAVEAYFEELQETVKELEDEISRLRDELSDAEETIAELRMAG